MKKKNYFGIDVQELSEKEMNLILNENNLKNIEHIGGDIVHYLSNGSVIFEMENIKGYLFDNTDDFNKFIERSSKPQPMGDSMLTYTHPIKDSLFIDKIEQYVTFFFGQRNITLDFGNKGDLEKFDEILKQKLSYKLAPITVSQHPKTPNPLTINPSHSVHNSFI